MSLKSFRQMIADKEIKRADAMKARLEDLHEEPGFNLRAEGEDLEQSISDLAEFIAAGGQIPALEVRPRAEGGLWLVDGHRRARALRKLDSERRLPRADGEAWVAIVAFTGNDADRVARVITSQEGRKLSPLELAEGYKRLMAFGWTPDQIAKSVGKSRSHVDHMMVLTVANSDVQQMIKAGAVSAATAVDLVREHGEGAGKVLAGELEKAKAQGKTKVTGGTMKGPSVPRSLLDDLHAESAKLHQALTADDHAMLEAFHRGTIDGGTIAVPVERLLNLHLVLEEAQRVLDDKKQRALAKATL